MGLSELFEDRIGVERLMVLAFATVSVVLFLAIQLSISDEAGDQRRVPDMRGYSDRELLELNTTGFTPTIVMGHLKNESVDWVSDELPNWPAVLYTVDDIPNSPYKIPINKGKESMPYLTYIIENYDDLPDMMIFLHAHRVGRHNDAPGKDNVRSLKYLRLSTVQQRGYVNLRCKWAPGCPDELYPLRKEHDLTGFSGRTEAVYADAWRVFFGPEIPVPEVVGVACCAQFAVTRKAVRRRTKEDYLRYRQWLLDTNLDDSESGRVLEYTWHVFFGETDDAEGVYCPDKDVCECEVYGVINGRC